MSASIIGTRPVRPDGVDKVTGAARFSADINLPGALHGAILRSPYAHARILRIDLSAARQMAGVKAVICAADMPDIAPDQAMNNGQPPDFRDMSANLLARDKVLYEGHAVAAVAAVDAATAQRALDAIDIEYAVLPHVIDVQQAMEPDAPILHEKLVTQGIHPAPTQASNIAQRYEQASGDVEAGFAEADVVISEEFTTQPVHQGYIEPHSCLARVAADGRAEIWCSSQGAFMVRQYCARLLAMPEADIRVYPMEIGGGFGGKTTIYLEPLAILLARHSGRAVRMQMSRAEVFRATGPAPGAYISLKMGARADGQIIAAQAVVCMQAGAFPGSPVRLACMTALAPYEIANTRMIGYDVVVNRPKSAAYRAPGAPMTAFAVESMLDMLAIRLGMDPLALRQKNAVSDGSRTAYGATFKNIGFSQTLEAAAQHPHYLAPLGPNQGRGVASGFWFNIGGPSSAAIHLNPDGSLRLTTANPDIGGSRASMAMMAAETLGVPLESVSPHIGDTASVAYSDMTGGSRVTFAVGMAVVAAADNMIAELRGRAARLWDCELEHVVWLKGQAQHKTDGRTLDITQLAAQAGKTGGPIAGHASLNAQGAGPGFGTHICDVEVDPDTGAVKILRYTVVQDVGRAIHPDFVEGQLQGGAVQGVGWALNEAYVYDENGCLLNPGFLDYRMPVASDLPMIDTVLVEVPNPRHPYGVKGVGEVPIVPPLAAVANAVSRAISQRMTDLPLNPPEVRKAAQRALLRRRHGSLTKT